MDEFERDANMRHSMMVVSITLLGMQSFAAEVIAHVRAGGVLDEEGIATVRATALRIVKNARADGAPMEVEAHAVRQAVEAFEQWIDAAIRQGLESRGD